MSEAAGKIKLKTDVVLEIPQEVAVCPICKKKLFAQFECWHKEDNGEWLASEINLNCESEPDLDSPDWDDWFSGHYSMPYVDWLPLEVRLLNWVNEKYCFDLD